MKKTIISVLISALFAGSVYGGCAIAVEADDTAKEIAFTDIETHWAKSAILSAVQRGIVRGYPDGTFKPNSNVTRAEFMKMLSEALELTVTGNEGKWFEPYVKTAIAAGIHSEADFTNYNIKLIRLELMRLVSRAMATNENYKAYFDSFSGLYNGDLPYVDYRDLSAKDIPFAALAIGSGVLGGYEDSTMGLKKNATRAEAVAMIERLLALKEKEPESIQALRELKEVAETGTNATSVSTLIPKADLSKDEVEVVTKNYTAKLKRYYVIPIEGTVRSIYERKFLWDRDEFPAQTMKIKGLRGLVVAVTDLTPNKDGDQEIFRQNTYISTPGAIFISTPMRKFGFIPPYPVDAVKLKKNVKSEVVFYGIYSNDYFNVNFQTNVSISGGWHRLLDNPDKPKQ